MKTPLTIFAICCLTSLSCNNSSQNSQLTSQDTGKIANPEQQLFGSSIKWLDSSKVEMAIDTTISYKTKNFDCDSVLAIDYTGFEGEYTFLPLNDKGQWINKIQQVKKLTQQQEDYVATVIGDKKSYSNPVLVACYEPRHGIVYFKNGRVIGQTAICLSCARLESTIKIGDPKREGLLNEVGRQKLNRLCKELQFSDCRNE
ncbi:MAG: hypothetical protein E6H07_13340 [Bacteroidetes bacterium]|nr:MAG: hypothetical protein E6H07_13340 [Bacteroidota bacterium]